MTIDRARKLLGASANNLTDEEINDLIQKVKSLANVCAELIDTRIKEKGSNFLYMATMK